MAEEGDRLLHALLGVDTPESAKAAAARALWENGHPQLVQAIKELSKVPALPPLPLSSLYAMARELPIASLLRACECSEESIAVFRDDVDISTVSELVRYCAADDSAEEVGSQGDESNTLRMLALEVDNVVTMSQLRKLVSEARVLCDVTSAGVALPSSSEAPAAPVD
jgi:hypothetical protein